jgi:ABC-type antimicrobial peptide transport system permease subunit
MLVAVSAALINYPDYVFKYLPLGEIFTSMTIAFIVGTGISVFASIGPAYFAARKQPVEAMRVEE